MVEPEKTPDVKRAEAELAKAVEQLAQTEGWDDVDPEAVRAFVEAEQGVSHG